MPTADALYRRSRAYSAEGDYQRAADALLQALDLAQQAGTPEDRAVLHSALGATYQSLAEMGPAREHLEAARSICRSLKDVTCEARALLNLASTYAAEARFATALELYQRAQQLLDSLDPRPAVETGAALMQVGALYGEMGQYARALRSLEKALAHYEKTGDRSGAASALHNMAYVHADLGEYATALDQFAQAAEIHKSENDTVAWAETMNSLGQTLIDAGRPAEALQPLKEALEVLEESDVRRLMAATLDSLGSAYRVLGDYPSALAHYQRALLIWRAIGDREGLRASLGNTGSVFDRQGRRELAILYYKRAVNVAQEVREGIRVLPVAEQRAYAGRVAKTYRRLADLLLRQDRVIEAQRVLDLLKIQEAEDYLGPTRGDVAGGQAVPTPEAEAAALKQLGALEDQAVQIGLELSRLRRAAPRDDKQETRYRQLDAMQRELLGRFVRFYESDEIAALSASASSQARRQALHVAELERLQDNIEKLGPGVVLLDPLVLDDRLELVLVTGVGPPIHRPVSVTRLELAEAVVQFRTAIEARSAEVIEPAKQLYDWIIRPWEPELQELGVRTILYAADSVLRYVPLAALHDGRRWLVERYSVANITAASVGELGTRRVEHPTVMAGAFTRGSYEFAIADQTYKLSGLRFAGEEVKALSRLFPHLTLVQDAAFSPAAVLPRLSATDVVHLATHAVLVPGKPYESFILFGDGERVTLETIKYDWTLSGVDLMVLSACGTAISERGSGGEEILGFGYLMEYKGAHATIASLWSVDDLGTQTLMSAFYTVLKEPGKNKAEALREAQLALIGGSDRVIGQAQRGTVLTREGEKRDQTTATDRLRHPYYWAPFVLIGSGL